ncbi:MAG TPA: hypothetical protein PKM20_06220 [Nitrosomonas sp.]|nr:hypothetical protein [Nitrosomonas sp.]
MSSATGSVPSILVGTWTYRSFLSNPDVGADFNSLEFGRGNIRIDPGPMQKFDGLIYGSGWKLDLKGSIGYGDSFNVRFQGVGVVGGAQWIYDYKGYLIPDWPNGIDQRPALVGSIVRTIAHPAGPNDQSTAPAGVVAQWVAVKRDDDA